MKNISINSKILNKIRQAIKIAVEYEKLTGRKLGITGEVAEVLVCKKLNLKLSADPLCAGYDAVDRRGKKYQIKSKRVLRQEGRLGSFSKHRFDYAILALLDKNYKVYEIWKAPYSKIKPIIARNKRHNPSVKKFKSVAKKI